jgi:exopolysaccharide production protein ExoQ
MPSDAWFQAAGDFRFSINMRSDREQRAGVVGSTSLALGRASSRAAKDRSVMRIAKRRLLDRDANALFAIPSVAVSMLVFAYSTRFGSVSILLFYAFWLPLFLAAPSILLVGAGRVVPLLVLPGFAALSTLWSDVPSATLRGAIQYGTTVFCGLVAARVVSMPSLAAGGMLGGLAVLAYSAANGGYAYDVVDGTYAFNGAFASKNQLGYFCSVTFLFSLAVLVLYRASAAWRLVATATCLFALALLWKSDSATSTLSLGFSVGVLALAVVVAMLPPVPRSAAICVILFGGVTVAAAAIYAGAFDATLSAFGKDTTLTGRTFLWQEGLAQGAEHPLSGLGYYAFWTPGRPAAEILWETFYITGKTGFHFHNTLIEAYVALGVPGVALVGGLTLALVVMAVLTVWQRTATVTSALCAALALLFVLRSAVEIDFFTPYTLGSFLVPFLLLNMMDRFAEEGRGWSAHRLRRIVPVPPARPARRGTVQSP